MKKYEYIGALLLQIIFVVLKVSGSMECNIAVMFLPIITFITIQVLGAISLITTEFIKKVDKEKLIVGLILACQIVLIILRAINIIKCSWLLILAPIEMPILATLLLLIGLYTLKVTEHITIKTK